MALLLGCVQPAMAPNINSATARVLDAAGIQTLVADSAGCCGAIRSHLGDHAGGLDDMRRNIDAWWPLVQGLTEAGPIEALVKNASGCGVTVKDYGRALAHDPAYADKAARVSAVTKDLSELLLGLLPSLKPRLKARPQADGGTARAKLAYHPPCTLQHGQRLRGEVEAGLRELGFDVQLPSCDAHLCCGSAGTYSVLQPALSKQLRDQKLQTLAPCMPTPSSRPISAASNICRAARAHRCGIGSKFWIKHWHEHRPAGSCCARDVRRARKLGQVPRPLRNQCFHNQLLNAGGWSLCTKQAPSQPARPQASAAKHFDTALQIFLPSQPATSEQTGYPRGIPVFSF